MLKINELTDYLFMVESDLDDLCKRLQDDYAGDVVFNQSEEDRLIIYNILEYIEKVEEVSNE